MSLSTSPSTANVQEATTPAGENAEGCCRSRRTLLTQMAIGGVAAGAALTLAACGPSTPEAAPTAPEATGDGHDVMAETALKVGKQASTKINKLEILLYRPDEKTVLAYSAVCTHAGCEVMPAEGTEFHCPCHNSVFSATDGANLSGPAPRPLTRYAASITDGQIRVFI